MPTTPLTLYTHPYSRGRIARWMLEETGRPYDTVLLDYGTSMKADEYKTIKMHATYSSLILSRIPALGDIAKWAMLHHEKHDKSGYPLGKGAADFTVEMDILAFADIFASLAENRPYRAALTQEKITEMLRSFTPDLLDTSVFEVIEKNMSYLYQVNAESAQQFYSPA